MKKLTTLILVLSSLTGCANRAVIDISGESNIDPLGVEKIFVGIPSLSALEGSTVRLDSEWVLTVKHNKPILITQPWKEVYYHPTCDIALIRDSGETPSYKVGRLFAGDQVFHAGYPVMRSYTVTKGLFVGSDQDVDEVGNYIEDSCMYSFSNTAIVSGMSGGGTFNEHGNLIGVNVGFINETIKFTDPISGITRVGVYPTKFLSILAVKDWLKDVTGRDYTLNRGE
ncbi:hypothetical protein NVP1170O_037 [Vibrio phage 1.170.O._10N.261.52.C3]|nr:hypothetical protein NVP1170O_037 [Vibrio phage 1.170.O._10N.261.52.C3]